MPVQRKLVGVHLTCNNEPRWEGGGAKTNKKRSFCSTTIVGMGNMGKYYLSGSQNACHKSKHRSKVVIILEDYLVSFVKSRIAVKSGNSSVTSNSTTLLRFP